jgi:phosphoglycolate phosphatase
MIKALILDMDGTLVDSGTMISNTINFVRENLGLAPLTKDTILHQINNPDINPAKFFYESNYFTNEQTKLFEEYYNENCTKEVELYNGIEKILKKYQKKFDMYIATNASDIFAHKICNHLNIKHYFKDLKTPDAIILGCTHFPLISEALKKYFHNKTMLIHSGDAIVEQLEKEFTFKEKYKNPRLKFFASENPDGLKKIAKRWLGELI